MEAKESENKENMESEEKEEKKEIVKPIALKRIFGYGSCIEKWFIFLGTIASMCQGVALPAMAIFFGEMIFDFNPENSSDQVYEGVKQQAINLIILGLVSFLLCFFMMCFWVLLGERLGIKFRILYLEAIFSKDITWFDLNKPQELPAKIINLCTQLQKGIGEKLASLIMTISMTIAGIVIGVVYGWQLAFSVTGIMPLIVIAAMLLMFAMVHGTAILQKAYATSGGFAEEALNSIRTVQAFSAQNLEENKYNQHLDISKKATLRRAKLVGVSQFLLNFCFGLTYALGYLIGSVFIYYEVYNHYRKRDYNGADVLIVFFAMVMGFFSFGQASPFLKSVREAQIAGAQIIPLIEKAAEDRGKEDTLQKSKARLSSDEFRGRIEMQHINFEYPTRENVKILEDFNMVFEEGKTTAICGETGCGKSTIIQLIERFYDPINGKVLIDGVDLKSLDLRWFRKNVGYVAQEPVLFDITIRQNILYGNEEASQKDIEDACKKANCYDFIMELPNKWEEKIGAQASKLSGGNLSIIYLIISGQKQRLAIARALIKKPKILLLDEATSALDRNSERAVQAAINAESIGLTCIIIAHRLTTIEKADKIIVMHDGKVAGADTHENLLEKCKLYAQLYESQVSKDDSEGEDSENSDKAEKGEGGEEDLMNIELNLKKRKSRRKSSGYRANESKKLKRLEEEEKTELENDKKEREALEKTFNKRIAQINKPYRPLMGFAVISSSLAGWMFPSIGIVFGFIVFDLMITDLSEMRKEINKDFAIYVTIAFFGGLFFVLNSLFFGKISANLTKTIRTSAYSKLLRMDTGFFDQEQSHPSKVTMALATDAELVNGVLENTIGSAIQALSGLIFALIISFVYSWRLCLVVLGTVPFMALSGLLQGKSSTGFAKQAEKHYAQSASILAESVKNFRTVTSFCNEAKVSQWYRESLDEPYKKITRNAAVSGVLWGLSQFIPFVQYASTFYFGSLFQKHYEINIRDMFVAIYVLGFAGMGMVNFFINLLIYRDLLKLMYLILQEHERQLKTSSILSQQNQRYC